MLRQRFPCLFDQALNTPSQAILQCGCTSVGTELHTSPTASNSSSPRHPQWQAALKCQKVCTRPIPAASAAIPSPEREGRVARASPSRYPPPHFPGLLGRRLSETTRLLSTHHSSTPSIYVTAGTRALNRLDGRVEGTTASIFAEVPHHAGQ